MSSRASTSSSTSDPRRPPGRRVLGWIRLTHPFPSILDGLVVAGVALLADADPGVASRLGLSMTLLQLGIGTVNDVVDAPFDAGLKSGKPIPAGLVSASRARAAAFVVFGLGLGLAGTIGPSVLVLAAVVIAVGLAYDLWLKGTAWSWLPFAVGIPILPVYGWLGARGALDGAFAILVPAAITAGAGLAIGNSLVDVDRDVAAGRTSVAARLGRVRAARLAAALFLIVLGLGAAALLPRPASAPALVAVAGATVASVAAGSAASRPVWSERAWQIEAVSMALAAIAWIAAVLR